MIDGIKQASSIGVPQGGPLSPLLSNIMLDVLDKELEKRKLKFVRYADDFVILVKSKRAGMRVQASVTRFLAKRLKLPVNQEKSKVITAQKASFLGFTFPAKKFQWNPQLVTKEAQRLSLETVAVCEN